MKFLIYENKIEILGKEDFNPQHILECGQIFSYRKIAESSSKTEKRKNEQEHVYDVFSTNKKAEIYETSSGYEIRTNDPEFFVKFFDLERDYSAIKVQLSKHEILKRPIEFGTGIRILKQDLFETLISFVISANNNIKRIRLILERMKERFGKNMGDYFAFPTREELLKASVQDFTELGAGYRAQYLFNVLRQIDEIEKWQTLPTSSLRNKLISLSGVGPKVADCVLLFGYGRCDVFPVDTWIEQMFHRYYGNKDLSRERIRQALTDEFGELSGFAQQYLFYFMRSGDSMPKKDKTL